MKRTPLRQIALPWLDEFATPGADDAGELAVGPEVTLQIRFQPTVAFVRLQQVHGWTATETLQALVTAGERAMDGGSDERLSTLQGATL